MKFYQTAVVKDYKKHSIKWVTIRISERIAPSGNRFFEIEIEINSNDLKNKSAFLTRNGQPLRSGYADVLKSQNILIIYLLFECMLS